ncbi:hypothetical protein DNTS_002251 [Danionella cerebrum]|uniref:G-protein coupled receptors family 1 profile domain-containing protein n=1 Tax=Danionella cerebrum TaxID=2873325 RepID=A0A553P0U7_9TELE|nr:hypothetical protein DNTS_002251 [Danionella translucida]
MKLETTMDSADFVLEYNYDYGNITFINSTYDEVSFHPTPQSTCFTQVLCLLLLVLNALICLLGLAGNAVVIWIAGVSMKKSVTTTWYLSLALSDFIFCACLPFNITYSVTSEWIFGLFMCKFTSFIMFLNMFSSIFLLVIISMDRCLGVMFPVWAQNHRTITKASVLIILAWVVSVALSLPSVVYRDVQNHLGTNRCINNYTSSQYSHKIIAMSRFVFGFVIPFVLIIFCYTIIILKLRASQMARSNKPFKIMTALILSFFLCWLPYHTFVLIELNQSFHNEAIILGLKIGTTAAAANSFLNPVLYVFMGKDFRRSFKSSFLSKIENAIGEDGRTISRYLSRSSSRSLFCKAAQNKMFTVEYDDETLSYDQNLPPGHCRDAECVILIVVDMIIFLLGTAGNGAVIWITGFKMKKSVNSTWYLSLALSDFIFCMILPFVISRTAMNTWAFGLFMCKFTSFVMILNMYSSIFLLVIISVDRCITATCPVWAQNHRTVKKASLVVLFAWLGSALLSVPAAKFRSITEDHGGVVCHAKYADQHTAITLIRVTSAFLIPFLVILICYSILIHKLRTNQMSKSTKPYKIMTLLIVTFFICWVPFQVVSIISLEHGPEAQTALQVTASIASANSCLNPLLYAFMAKDFKKKCYSFLSKIERAIEEENRSSFRPTSFTGSGEHQLSTTV